MNILHGIYKYREILSRAVVCSNSKLFLEAPWRRSILSLCLRDGQVSSVDGKWARKAICTEEKAKRDESKRVAKLTGRWQVLSKRMMWLEIWSIHHTSLVRFSVQLIKNKHYGSNEEQRSQLHHPKHAFPEKLWPLCPPPLP